MKLKELRYRIFALILVMAILPSMIGVHVFKHFCHGCHENSVVTTLITTTHSHSHDCSACLCSGACQDCHDESGRHVHHGENNCKHQFAKVDFEGQTAQINFAFIAVEFDLLYSSELIAEMLSDYTNDKYRFLNVIQNIPDEPSPEKNCVFLL